MRGSAAVLLGTSAGICAGAARSLSVASRSTVLTALTLYVTISAGIRAVSPSLSIVVTCPAQQKRVSTKRKSNIQVNRNHYIHRNLLHLASIPSEYGVIQIARVVKTKKHLYTLNILFLNVIFQNVPSS